MTFNNLINQFPFNYWLSKIKAINVNSIIDFQNLRQSISIQLYTFKINQFLFNYLLSKCPHDNSLTSIAFGHGQPLWLPLMGKWTLHVDMGKFLDMAEIGS